MDWQEEVAREDLALRKKEVRTQGLHLFVATLFLAAAVLTAWAAVKAAQESAKAVAAGDRAIVVAQDSTLRASRQQRLSDGLLAIGGDTPAQRIAGLYMLRAAATDGLDRIDQGPETVGNVQAQDFADAKATYGSTLKAFENYVGAWNSGRADVTTLNDYAVPKDVQYALNELDRLLDRDLDPALDRLGAKATLDLSNSRLRAVHLPGFDVAWLDGHYFYGIDLRAAGLKGSKWGRSNLQQAHLQGAHLECADLREADLREADLRGAHLDGANLTGAKLEGAQLNPGDLDGAIVDDAAAECS